jgi:hypothetical protein
MNEENTRPLIMGAIKPIPRGTKSGGPGLTTNDIKPRPIVRPAGAKKKARRPAISTETAKPPVRIPRPESLYNPEALPPAPVKAPEVPAPAPVVELPDPAIPAEVPPADVQAPEPVKKKTSTRPKARRSTSASTSRAGSSSIEPKGGEHKPARAGARRAKKRTAKK